MVEFLKCASLCPEYLSDERLDSFIGKLNETFSHMSCECHPNATWKIGVDLMKDCKYNFHNTWEGNPPCGFERRLILNEIKPMIA